MPAPPTAVVLRESGGPSTPRLLGSIITVSGILDHPHSRVMTTEYVFAISRRIAPEVCWKLFALGSQRAQGRPGARCTRGLVCNGHKEVRTRAYRSSGEHPAFPAQWLYGLYRALPGERLSCHRRFADVATQ